MTTEHSERAQAIRSAIAEKLVPIIERAMDAHGLAGLAVAIVADGEILLVDGYGKRNLESGAPVTARSLFHMASISKSFVATAILQLWENGRLDLDAPVVNYLPYFKLGGDSGQITVRHLLSHTGGVPDSEEYAWHRPEFDDGALERYVRSLAAEEMIGPPGQRFAYSNPAFEVLGDVIAKVSGQSFEAYVKDHILAPLGMGDSTFLRAEVPPDLATTPHFGAPLMVLPDAYPYNRAHAASSTLHASAADMGRWLLANLAHGELDGRRILRQSTYETAWRPVAETGEEIWMEAACLGWFRGTYRGQPVIHHGGSDPGYWTEVVLLPAQKVGVAMMANAYTATGWRLCDAALDLLLGLEPTPPPPPITVPVGEILQSAGPEAAVAEYQRLQTTAPEAYDFGETRFNDVTWGAVEVYQPAAVMPLLHLWATLFPQSPHMHEALGRAYMVEGKRDLAIRHLQQALALDPEREMSKALLRRLVDRQSAPGA